ncbi:hypothetical protein ACOMHN_045607 [Nucella lapillus]
MRVLAWKKRTLVLAAVLSSTALCFWGSFLHFKPAVPVAWTTEPHHLAAGPGQELREELAATSRDVTERQERHIDDADFLPSPLLIPRLAEYCNVPERVEEGEEGEAPKDYILRSVYILIVHGDSTPVASLPDLHPSSQNCTMDSEVLRHFPQLRHFRSDMETQSGHQHSGSEFFYWALHPQHTRCGTLQLTGQGALQHLLTGLALKDKYVHKLNLFGEKFSPSEQLQLRSTQLSRTYQSAVAFLYAFLPRFNITQLDMRAARNALFCDHVLVPPDCCKSLHRLQQKMEREQSRFVKNNGYEVPVLEALAEVLKVRKEQLPPLEVLMDVLQSYACHGLSLPCSGSSSSSGGEKCVTAAMLKELLQLMDYKAGMEGTDLGMNCYSRVLTHPLFLDILTSMTRVSRGQSRVKFTIYSGHDLTLTSVLQALGVHEGRRLRNAARLVLELYSLGEKGGHHVRVVRDGKDVTSLVRFCRGRTVSGLCRLKELETFVTRDNGALLGVTDPQGAAAFCHLRHLF